MRNQRRTVFASILLSLTALILVDTQILAQTQSCTADGPCRCVMNDGTGAVDISSIGGVNGQARFPNSPSYDGVPFAYNPCYSINLDNCQNAAVCKKVNGTFIGQGSQESAQWSFPGFYPMITYSSSDKKTEIMLICDATFLNPQLTVVGELPGGTTGMMLWTKCACPGACKGVEPPPSNTGGLSVGSIVLIIFPHILSVLVTVGQGTSGGCATVAFICVSLTTMGITSNLTLLAGSRTTNEEVRFFSLLILYLGFGAAINSTKADKSGREVLPNYNSWSLLPGLILDGFRQTRKIICCGREEKYEPI